MNHCSLNLEQQVTLHKQAHLDVVPYSPLQCCASMFLLVFLVSLNSSEILAL